MMRDAWLVAVGLMLAGVGCATSSGEGGEAEESSDRRVPPAVTDYTVDERSESARSHRPRVDVRLDRGKLIGVEPEGYEATVRRGAQQCYSRSVRGKEASAEGSVVYEVLVTRNGFVAGTDIMSTGLRNETVQRCVARVISRLRFDVPVRNRPVFRLFFRFNFYLETLVPTEPPV